MNTCAACGEPAGVVDWLENIEVHASCLHARFHALMPGASLDTCSPDCFPYSERVADPTIAQHFGISYA